MAIEFLKIRRDTRAVYKYSIIRVLNVIGNPPVDCPQPGQERRKELCSDPIVENRQSLRK